MNDEQWNPVAGFEGRYEVSNQGRVRSVSRDVPKRMRDGSMGTRRIKGRILATHTWGAQYPGIALIDGHGVKTRKMVHQLVAETFIPNPHGYTQVNHLDANKENASAANLEWCNQSMNMVHAYAIGNRGVGKQHQFSRLPRDAAGRCVAEGAPV